MTAKSAIPKALKHISGLKKAPLFEPGVYFLLHNEEVVYVGQSVQPTVRIGQHLSEGKKVFTDAFVQHVPEAALDQVETMFIQMMKPKYNVSEGPSEWKTHGQLRAATMVDALMRAMGNPQIQNAQHPQTKHRNDGQKLLRLPEVESITGIKKSTIYKLMKEGRFPQCVKVSARISVWPSDKVADWCERAAVGEQLMAAPTGIEPVPAP